MSVWLRTLIAVALVSAVPLAATVLLANNERLVRAVLPNLLSFGVGVLVVSASLHLIPEALNHSGPIAVSVMVVLGFVLFAGLERWLEQHDHGHVHGLAMGVPSHEHDHEHTHGHEHETARPTAAMPGPDQAKESAASRALLPMAFGADVLHNFIDGILIASTFLIQPELGLLTAMAIGLHELPRELGTFGLFVHGGLTPKRALLFNAFTALFALTGAGVTLLLGSRAEQLAITILPFAAGTMLYIALTVARSVLPRVDGVFPVRRLGWLAAGGTMVGLMVA